MTTDAPPPPARSQAPMPTRALGAGAVAALALGAVAIGALAIARLAIGRLVIGRGTARTVHVRHLTIDELKIGRIVRD